MILLREIKKKRELVVIVIGDEKGNLPCDKVADMVVEWYRGKGYSVNTLIYPLATCLPAEVQEVYNTTYKSKAILDTLLDVAAEDFLPSVLSQVVREEISKFDIQEIAETVVDYETSMGLSPISKE